jgi:hypothetical protein
VAIAVSATSSKEAIMNAASFSGVRTSAPSVGVVSVTITPSATQFAVVPADVTPFHAFAVVRTVRQIRRHGFALPALVNMIELSSTSGSRYCPPVPVSSIRAARQAMTSW